MPCAPQPLFTAVKTWSEQYANLIAATFYQNNRDSRFRNSWVASWLKESLLAGIESSLGQQHGSVAPLDKRGRIP
jgi:hypothetical protein